MFDLRFFIVQTTPILDQIRINSKTGQIYLTYPLNSTILTDYDRQVSYNFSKILITII